MTIFKGFRQFRRALAAWSRHIEIGNADDRDWWDTLDARSGFTFVIRADVRPALAQLQSLRPPRRVTLNVQ